MFGLGFWFCFGFGVGFGVRVGVGAGAGADVGVDVGVGVGVGDCLLVCPFKRSVNRQDRTAKCPPRMVTPTFLSQTPSKKPFEPACERPHYQRTSHILDLLERKCSQFRGAS